MNQTGIPIPIASIWLELKQGFGYVWELLNTPFGHLGTTAISVGFLIYLVLSILVVLFLASKIKQLLISRILSRTTLDTGVSQSIGTIVRYMVVVLGLLIVFQSAGLDLSSLSLLAGAVGVGIGFGLQNIFNNLISGLIILFERPVKVGDRVQIGDVSGDVVRIASRATTIITNDNISIIVPNSEFVSSRVINWSHNDRMVRFRIPLRIALHEDPLRVKELLLQVAHEHPDVLKSPDADVIFTAFGESALEFELWVWTIKLINRPVVFRSQLNYAIYRKLRDNNIEIPYPQHDLHIRSGLGGIKKEVPEA